LVVAADDELEEVVPEHLEHHAHVGAVHAADLEVVEQLKSIHCTNAFSHFLSCTKKIVASPSQKEEIISMYQ
jgi:hypothetical protein